MFLAAKRLLAVFAVVLIVAGPDAAAQPPGDESVARYARRLADRGLLRQAEQTLLASLGSADDLADEEFADLSLTLADVYLASGLPDRALDRSADASERLRDADEDAVARGDALCAAAEAAARAHLALGDEQGAAREVARLEALTERLPRDPLRQIRVLGARAEAAATFPAFDDDAAEERLDQAVDALVEVIREESNDRTPAWRFETAVALSDMLRRLDREPTAAAVLEWVSDEYGEEPPRGVDPVYALELLSDVRESLGETEAERAALVRGLDLLRGRDDEEPKQRGAIQLRMAEIHRRLAVSSGADDPAAAERSLSDADRSIGEALRIAAAMPDADREASALRALAELRGSEIELARSRLAADKRGDFAEALTGLVERLSDSLLEDDPRLATANTALAAERVTRGEFGEAKASLAPAVAAWRRVPNADFDLARALLLLSEVEFAEGEFDRSATTLDEAAVLIAGLNPDDASVADATADRVSDEGDAMAEFGPRVVAAWLEVYRGRLAAAEGRYTDAIARYDAADRACDAAPDASGAARAASLLHRSLVYRTLSRFDDAIAACRAATQWRRESIDRADARLLPYCLALGGVAAASGNEEVLREAVQAADALDAERQQGYPLLLHLRAIGSFLASQRLAETDPTAAAEARAAARGVWRDALRLQEARGLRVDAARSRHYLSRADLRDALVAVEAAREAFEAARNDELLRDRGVLEESVAELNRQWADYESDYARYRVGEADAPAFEDLVTTHERLREDADRLAAARQDLIERHESEFREYERRLGDGEARRALDSALAYAFEACDALERLARRSDFYPRLHYTALVNQAEVLYARSRVLGESLEGAVDKLKEAVELVEKPRANVGDDKARAEFFARHASAFDLLVEWLVAEGRHTEAIVYAELSRNRTLLDQQRSSGALGAAEGSAPLAIAELSPRDIAETVRGLRDARRPVVYYYIGEHRSYVFLLGFGDEVRAERLRETSSDGRLADVGRERAHEIVGRHLAVLGDRRAAARLVRDGSGAKALASLTPALLSGGVLDALRSTAASDAAGVTIVPDGPLFQLPFAAMVTSVEPLTFLLDEAPPIVVTPSLMLTATDGAAGEAASAPSLLSVADPIYPTRKRLRAAAVLGSAASRYASLGGSLQRLEGTDRESEQVAALFPAESRWRLKRGAATEAALRGALRRKPTVLHIATHGVASNETGVIDGMLALAAPPGGEPVNDASDGFLELSEVAGLRLTGCQLAVLSACETSVGDVRLLEMGNSFARAFLTAGAMRVVATNWDVDDRSAAELVGAFFNRLDLGKGRCASNAAAALRAAQRELRASDEWRSPYHWAAFTLVGVGDRAGSAPARVAATP